MPVPLAQPIVAPAMVGREAALAALAGLLEHAGAGQGQCILVAGEAGLGKSRLVAEAKRWARQHGLLVLEGHCLEPDATLPYAPFIDLLHDFAGAHGGSLAEPLLEPLLRAERPPGAARPKNEAPQSAQDEPAENKRRLFQALEQWLAQAGEPQPRLVVIEDAHWADEASLDFLYYLIHRLPAKAIALVLTYRSEEVAPKLARFLARLERQRLATEIVLAPLSRAETAEMLGSIFALRRPARAEFLNLIYGLTEGNPFFIEEVLKSLVAAGDIFYTEGEWDRKPIEALRLPRSLRLAVRERTEQLSPGARQILEVAAVAGRRFDFTLLRELTGMDEPTVLMHIQALVEAQLVTEVSAEEFAFRHALTREAVYATLLKRQRLQFHALVAEVLERLPGTQRAADLAYHYREAANWPKALEYARRAGEQAQELYAPYEASEHFTRAIEAARQLDRPLDLNLLRCRGQAYETLGEFEHARADYELSLRLAREAGAAGEPNGARTEWQTLLDLGFLWAGRDYARAGEFFRLALERARAMDDPLTLAHSFNRMGNWLTNTGRPPEGLQAHRQALEIFRRQESMGDVAATHDLMGMAYSFAGDGLSAKAQVEQAIEQFRRAGDKRGLVSSLATHCTLASETDIQTWTGQSEQSCRAELAEALELAQQIGWLAGQALVQWTEAFCLSSFGELGDALAQAMAARQTAAEIEHRQWSVAAEFTLGQVYTLLLAPEEALRHLEAARLPAFELGSAWWIGSVTAVAALAHLQLGHGQAATAALQAAADALGLPADWPAHPPRTLTERYLCWAWAETALANDQPAAALAAAERLIDSLINPDQEPIPHLLKLKGEALTALNQFAAAELALDQALEGARKHQARPVLWQIHRDRGRLAQRWRRPAQAASEFAAARSAIDALASTLAPGPLKLAFVASANAQLPPPRPTSQLQTAKDQFSGLTQRERQVAALVARGQSNREIAAELVLSERTVKTHVANILSKLGLTSRVQVATWAAEHGLANSR